MSSTTQTAPAASGAPRRRRLDIDLLKAIGCLFVVFYHLQGAPFTVGGQSSPVGYYLNAMMAISVPLFFLASGALYARRDLTLGSALAKVARLAVLMVFWMAISTFVRMTMEGALGMWLDACEPPRWAWRAAPLAFFGAPLVLGAFGLAYSHLSGDIYGVAWEGIVSCSAVVTVTGLYLMVRRWASEHAAQTALDRLVTFVEANSFSVYVLHWLVCPPVFARIPHGSSFALTAAVALAFATVIVLAAAAIGSLMRRTPLRALFAG